MRMNGNCAGGTGAFIDQMALILGVSVDELDVLKLKTYIRLHRVVGFSQRQMYKTLLQEVFQSRILQCRFSMLLLCKLFPRFQKACRLNSKDFILRRTFKIVKKKPLRVLSLEEKDFITLENSNLIPAMGCVFYKWRKRTCINQLIENIKTTNYLNARKQ